MKTTNLPLKLSINEIQVKYKEKVLTPEALIQEIVARAEEDKDFNIWITPPQSSTFNLI